jgi:formylglycine-generating enzyme required for sulfatase activity
MVAGLTSVALDTGAAPAPVFRESGKGVTNSIGMKLATIPPGRFSMGSPEDEKDRIADEGPEHKVSITKGFHLGMYEVTQGEYEEVMGSNPSYISAVGEGNDKVKGLKTARFPVERVSYEDAVKFCEKLSALKGEKEGKRMYRLPSEAEWEYACRGGAGSKTPFHFGKSLTADQANFDGNYPYPYRVAPKGTDLGRTCEVGSYKPNGFGLYDMHGNVWEWCSDRYDKDYYNKGDKVNPSGPFKGTDRVIRGGGWIDSAWYCRSARRVSTMPTTRSSNVGFRVALVPAK